VVAVEAVVAAGTAFLLAAAAEAALSATAAWKRDFCEGGFLRDDNSLVDEPGQGGAMGEE
jgi:hypothetical protein